MAQNDDRRNNTNHGTDAFIFTLFAHKRFGTDKFIIRLRSDDIV